jgi:hypothetical protein
MSGVFIENKNAYELAVCRALSQMSGIESMNPCCFDITDEQRMGFLILDMLKDSYTNLSRHFGYFKYRFCVEGGSQGCSSIISLNGEEIATATYVQSNLGIPNKRKVFDQLNSYLMSTFSPNKYHDGIDFPIYRRYFDSNDCLNFDVSELFSLSPQSLNTNIYKNVFEFSPVSGCTGDYMKLSVEFIEPRSLFMGLMKECTSPKVALDYALSTLKLNECAECSDYGLCDFIVLSDSCCCIEQQSGYAPSTTPNPK